MQKPADCWAKCVAMPALVITHRLPKRVRILDAPFERLGRHVVSHWAVQPQLVVDQMIRLLQRVYVLHIPLVVREAGGCGRAGCRRPARRSGGTAGGEGVRDTEAPPDLV